MRKERKVHERFTFVYVSPTNIHPSSPPVTTDHRRPIIHDVYADCAAAYDQMRARAKDARQARRRDMRRVS